MFNLYRFTGQPDTIRNSRVSKLGSGYYGRRYQPGVTLPYPFVRHVISTVRLGLRCIVSTFAFVRVFLSRVRASFVSRILPLFVCVRGARRPEIGCMQQSGRPTFIVGTPRLARHCSTNQSFPSMRMSGWQKPQAPTPHRRLMGFRFNSLGKHRCGIAG